jgi:hypothetical protein
MYLPIKLTFTEKGDLEMEFMFEYPGSPTKEKLVFNSIRSLDEKGILQPYGIEFIIPNEQEFYVNFMMVEEISDDDIENFTGVAKFNTAFILEKNKFFLYDFLSFENR